MDFHHMKREAVVLLAVALLIGTGLLLILPGRADAAPGARQATQPFVSVGFDIGWQAEPAADIPWTDLTQLDLFALETTNGTALDTHFLSSVNVLALTAAAHNRHVTALITIGGSSDQNWQNACNATNRAGFVSNLVSYMQSNGFDGIDLDIEDDVWASQGPPSPAMTTCIEAISTAAKAVKTQAGATPVISADVITNWEGPWFAPSQTNVDQFNLMTYGDTCTPTCATFAADVQATESQGLPLAKMVVGIDDIDSYPVAGDCGRIASYAQTSGLAGVMTWDITTDAGHGYACFNQFASSTGGTAPTPSPTNPPSPTPTSTPTNTPTPSPSPPPPSSFPCVVLVSGKMEVGTCTGTFTPGS